MMNFYICYFIAIVCGGSIGAALIFGLTGYIRIPIAILGTGATLVYAHLAPILARRRQLAAQRRKEHRLIEP